MMWGWKDYYGTDIILPSSVVVALFIVVGCTLFNSSQQRHTTIILFCDCRFYSSSSSFRLLYATVTSDFDCDCDKYYQVRLRQTMCVYQINRWGEEASYYMYVR